MMKHFNRFGCSIALALMAALMTGRATDRTWDGEGNNNNWSTPGNWGGTAPEAGDALFFDGTTRLASTNDFVVDTAFGGITFNAGAGSFTLGGNRITLDGNVVNPSASNQAIALDILLGADRGVDVSGTGRLTVSGVLSGTGGLTKTGDGTLVVVTQSEYEGITTLSAGILEQGRATALGTNSPRIVVASGATLDMAGYSLDRGAGILELSGAGYGGNGALRISKAVSSRILSNMTLQLVADATIRCDQRMDVQSGGIDMDGYTLTKTGNGDLVIGYGAITVTNPGKMIVNSGILRLQNNNFNTDPPLEIQVNNGVLDYWEGANRNQLQNVALYGSARLTTSWAGIFPLFGTVTLNGAAHEIGVGVQFPGAFGGPDLRGKVTGPGGFVVRKPTTNYTTLILSNPENDYDGHTVVNAYNILRLGDSEVIPHGPGKGSLTLQSGAAGAATLDLNGFNDTINGLIGTSGTVLGRVLNSKAASTGTLTVGGNNATSTFAGLILDNAGTGGTVALTKIGEGTLTLFGANTFSGGTTVNDGVLAVNNVSGSGTGSGTVTVNADGMLSGTGTVAGVVTVDGGTVAPGTSTGILTVGGLTMENDAVFAVELLGTAGGTEHDQLVVTAGEVTLDGTASLSVTLGYAPVIGDSFTILQNQTASAINGRFAEGSGFSAAFEGKDYAFSVDYAGGDGNDLVLTVVSKGTLVILQ